MSRLSLFRPPLLLCAALAMAPAASWSAPASVNLKLRDTRWALETLDGAPVSEARVQLVLASSSQQLSGHAGCNRLRGRYTQRGTQLALKPMATTRKACPAAQMALEERFLQTLGRIDGYRVEGTGLSLLQGDTVQATFRALDKR
jgi:heat shock protein HslJ